MEYPISPVNTTTIPHDATAKLADPTIQKIFFDAVSEVPRLLTQGVTVNNYSSLLLLHQIISGDLSTEVDLERLMNLYKIKPSSEDVMEQHPMITLYHEMISIAQRKDLLETISREANALPAIVELNFNGIKYDFEASQQVIAEYCSQRDSLKQELFELLSATFAIDDPKELVQALYKAGFAIRGVSVEALQEYDEDNPVISRLIAYKQLTQKINLYGTRLQQQLSPQSRLSPHWHPVGTKTFRATCSSPNIQGFPKALRKYFSAASGMKLVSADYSQIDLRVLAEYSQEPKFLNAFQNGIDLHAYTASKLLKVDIGNITERERKVGKLVNFGMVYGSTAAGLKKSIAKAGFEVSLKQASSFRDGFYANYPKIKQLQSTLLTTVSIHTRGGYTFTGLPKGKLSRLNLPIQTTASEGMKASLHILMSHKKDGWRLVNLIHDQIVMEVPEGEVQEAAETLRQAMTHGMSQFIPSVPILVETQIFD